MLKIIEGGLWTTVQDQGRPGYYSGGIPPSGAMDMFAHSIANALVRNPINFATLEATLMGPKIQFEADAFIAVTGAEMTPCVNGVELPMWQSFAVKPGDILTLSYAKSGCRAYIAVSGGIEVPLVLGSRSTYSPAFLGGHRGRIITAGAQLKFGATDITSNNLCLPASIRPMYPSMHDIAVILGPQDYLFSDDGIAVFLGSDYKVTNKSNRTASRLSGPSPEMVDRVRSPDEGSGLTDIIEDGNAIGTIQIAGGTEPIIMLRDAPSTGAYAKIATLITAEMDGAGQIKPTDTVRFHSVSFEDAKERLITQQKLYSEAFAFLE